MGIEQYHRRTLRNDAGKRDRFLAHALVRIGGTALPDFNDFDIAQAKLAAGLRRALAVALAQLTFRAPFQASNGGNDDAHRAARLSA